MFSTKMTVYMYSMVSFIKSATDIDKIKCLCILPLLFHSIPHQSLFDLVDWNVPEQTDIRKILVLEIYMPTLEVPL